MPRRISLAILISAAALLGSAGVAQASITVANTNDAGPGSLRQDLEEAPVGETIALPAGTYTLTSESLLLMQAVTIAGHGAGDTIIRAGNPFRVLEIVDAGNVTISGVTVRDGRGITSGPQGIGILSVGTELTLREDVVTNNVADADGAAGVAGGSAQAAGILSVSGRLSLIGSKVTDNTASANGGSGAKGGATQGAGMEIVGPYTIKNSTISGNTAEARGGQGPSSGEQDGGIVEGSGILAVNSESLSSSITGSTISDNTADASGGAGGEKGSIDGGAMLEVSSNASISIAATTIADNITRAKGESAGTTVIGGGVLVVNSSPGSVSIVGSTLSGNSLEVGPGGTGEGGNIFTSGPVSFADTIIANGVGPAGSENCASSTPITSLGFNLDSRDQCGFPSPGDLVNKDPLLGPLQDNGGPTQTMAPAANSPAVDQGTAFGLAADQRGVIRPIDLPSIPNAPNGDGSDIGAYELQPSNAFTLGKLQKNKKKGTATLSVSLPQPSAGTLSLTGKGVHAQNVAVTGQATVKLKVALKGGAAKALRKKGKRKVKLEVIYTPTANVAATKSLSTKLLRKLKGHRKRHARP